MWCERIIAKFDKHVSIETVSVDWIDVQWNECGRVLKKKTRSGEAVCIVLPAGQSISHHDVIYQDAFKMIAINLLPCEVLVCTSSDHQKLIHLALELGNLHLPVQIDHAGVAFIDSELARPLIEKLEIDCIQAVRRFEPTPLICKPVIEKSADFQVILRARKAVDSQAGVHFSSRKSDSSLSDSTTAD